MGILQCHHSHWLCGHGVGVIVYHTVVDIVVVSVNKKITMRILPEQFEGFSPGLGICSLVFEQIVLFESERANHSGHYFVKSNKSDLLSSLFWKERGEWLAHRRCFVKGDERNLLKVALFKEKRAICSWSLFEKRYFEQKSERANSHPCFSLTLKEQSGKIKYSGCVHVPNSNNLNN